MTLLNLDSIGIFHKWEKIKDIIDQLMDFTMNYRQSGHPGGSHSKVHMLVSLMFSGEMKYDMRKPENPYADRFILSSGHTVPLIYSTLALIGEAFRLRYQWTGNERFYINPEKIVMPIDLLSFRRRGGLPGHAEYCGKTLFLKFNTGASAHGLAASVGQALALKKAGLEMVRVFVIEGDAALTAGASHESKNSAWGYGLGNLFWLVDWNDYGIDDHTISSVVNGTPKDWFAPYGWKVYGTEKGYDWFRVLETIKRSVKESDPLIPNVIWFKTRKGRDYGIYDNKSHGTPHRKNCDNFWESRKSFMKTYGLKFVGFCEPEPKEKEEEHDQWIKNIRIILKVLQDDYQLVEYITDTLVDIGNKVPNEITGLKIKGNPFSDSVLYDYKKYPHDIYVKPGERVPNRSALVKFGAWLNSYSAIKYGRSIIIATSADLTESTQIHGFGLPYGTFKGYGWYDRIKNIDGTLLPSEITEQANAGVSTGMASVNFSKDPFHDYDGFWTITSTYGSFSYLKYGMMRLFSQMAQDCPVKLGKVIWVMGHSGPETAEDSRTHFGIFEPGVSQLFPKGSVINLYPWEFNEVPVIMGEAMSKNIPIIILHLTRPSITIPDREKLKIPSHFEAAKGAYLIRDFKFDSPKDGTIILRGTSTTDGIIKILPKLDQKYNLKIIAAISYELFMMQTKDYQRYILSEDDWKNSMVITNEASILMNDWIYSKETKNYSISSDWDNRWRTGGSLDEVLEEAHLTPEHLLNGIERFVSKFSK